MKLIVKRDVLSALRHPESIEKLYLKYPKGPNNYWIEMVHS